MILFQIFVMVFTDRQLEEESWSFSVFKLEASYRESLLFPWFQIQSKYACFVKDKHNMSIQNRIVYPPGFYINELL